MGDVFSRSHYLLLILSEGSYSTNSSLGTKPFLIFTDALFKVDAYF